MVILTLNCGSSSVKYQIFNWKNKEILASGAIERVATDKSFIEHKVKGREEYIEEYPCPDHRIAIELIMKTILNPDHGVLTDIKEIGAVGHRVVHGGDKFAKSVIVTQSVLDAFREIQDLSPLHNPANIMGIEAAKKVLPDVHHCAVMDTAWHQTMPAASFMYALPYDWYTKHNVRRYGFHGTSYIYTAKRASVLLGQKPLETNLIIAHIGNGASICAVKDGVCLDTSMGLTPLEGLIMGTRCGDIDPAIIPYMSKQTGKSVSELDIILNKKSGLLGITGKYSDRRDIQAKIGEGDEISRLAQDMEAYRIKKYIGAYSAALGRVDAIVFTAGVGEMNSEIRIKILDNLENLGIKLDLKRNMISKCKNGETRISADDSPVKIFVIPTDEELVMTEDTYALVTDTYDIHTRFAYTFQEKEYINKDRAERLGKDIELKPELNTIIAEIP